jgi:hypothetical protein
VSTLCADEIEPQARPYIKLAVSKTALGLCSSSKFQNKRPKDN